MQVLITKLDENQLPQLKVHDVADVAEVAEVKESEPVIHEVSQIEEKKIKTQAPKKTRGRRPNTISVLPSAVKATEAIIDAAHSKEAESIDEIANSVKSSNCKSW